MTHPETISMWRSVLKHIVREKELRKEIGRLGPEELKFLLHFYHHKVKRNKEIFNEVFPHLLKKIKLIERRRRLYERRLKHELYSLWHSGFESRPVH